MGRNADVFREFHAAWTAGDLPAVLALTDPDVVVRPLHGALFTRGEFRGHDGMRDWYRELTDPWDRLEAIVECVRDTPEGAKGVLKVVGYRGEEGLHVRVGVDVGMRDGRVLTITARNVHDVEDELAAD